MKDISNELSKRNNIAHSKEKKGKKKRKKKGGKDQLKNSRNQDSTTEKKSQKGRFKADKYWNDVSYHLKKQNVSFKQSQRGVKKCQKKKSFEQKKKRKGKARKKETLLQNQLRKEKERKFYQFEQKKIIIMMYNESRRIFQSSSNVDIGDQHVLPKIRQRTSKIHEIGYIAKKRKKSGVEKAGRKQKYICKQQKKDGRTELTRHARQRFRERGASTGPVYKVRAKTTVVITYVPIIGKEHKENCRAILKEVWRNKKRSTNLNIPRTRLSCQDAASLAHSKKMCKELDHWRRLNRRYTSYKRAGSVCHHSDFQQPTIPQSLRGGLKWKRV